MPSIVVHLTGKSGGIKRQLNICRDAAQMARLEVIDGANSDTVYHLPEGSRPVSFKWNAFGPLLDSERAHINRMYRNPEFSGFGRTDQLIMNTESSSSENQSSDSAEEIDPLAIDENPLPEALSEASYDGRRIFAESNAVVQTHKTNVKLHRTLGKDSAATYDEDVDVEALGPIINSQENRANTNYVIISKPKSTNPDNVNKPFDITKIKFEFADDAPVNIETNAREIIINGRLLPCNDIAMNNVPELGSPEQNNNSIGPNSIGVKLVPGDLLPCAVETIKIEVDVDDSECNAPISNESPDDYLLMCLDSGNNTPATPPTDIVEETTPVEINRADSPVGSRIYDIYYADNNFPVDRLPFSNKPNTSRREDRVRVPETCQYLKMKRNERNKANCQCASNSTNDPQTTTTSSFRELTAKNFRLVTDQPPNPDARVLRRTDPLAFNDCGVSGIVVASTDDREIQVIRKTSGRLICLMRNNNTLETVGVINGNRDRFLCEICASGFTRLHNLNVHKETVHKGTRKFLCGECGSSFQVKSNLNAHMKRCHQTRKRRDHRGKY